MASRHLTPAQRDTNELACSLRLEQLRRLQGQLSAVVIRDDLPDAHACETSSPYSSVDEQDENDAERSALLPTNDGTYAQLPVHRDLESGHGPPRHGRVSSAAARVLDPDLLTVSLTHALEEGSDLTSGSLADLSAADRSTDPTVGTDGSGRTGRSGWSLSRPSRRRTKAANDKALDSSSRSWRKRPRGFLSQNHETEKRSLLPHGKWHHLVFLCSLAALLACLVTLWAPYPLGARVPSDQVAQTPWSDGCVGVETCICPRETICADRLLYMILLTVARASAFFDYPLYMLLFLSKAHNLNDFLQGTALRCWVNFCDYHRIHGLFGTVVGVECASHSFFHLLRWALRNDDIRLLWTSQTGITGLVVLIITPFLVLPMLVPCLKRRMTFEWRKGLHYLSIPWGIALMCHAPQRIFWLIGVPLVVYAADKVVGGLFKTHLIESARFQRLGDDSCLISFENPPGSSFGKQNAAYCYVMLPWLSRTEWHAYTLFPSHDRPNHSSICVQKRGDWTERLLERVATPADKPAFVVGPFLSPFSSPAMDSENLAIVATGIGVTPAISLIRQYSHTSRRLNLVWVCRDPGLVEHFVANVDFGTDGYTLIYYTGKDRDIILTDELPANVFLFNGRPNLERTIGGIISSIATGLGLPEELHRKVVTRTPAEMRSRLLLERALSLYTMDQLFDYTVKSSLDHDEFLELRVDEVNYFGVLSTMKHLLGNDFDDLEDKMARNIEKVDVDCVGRLGRAEFEDFFALMLEGADDVANAKRGLQRMSACREMFESGRDRVEMSEAGLWRDDFGFGIKKHLQGEGKFAARNWAMLYCGGSEEVLDQMKAFKRKFGVGLSVEKFDW